jgi:hypothetical protein
MLGTIVGQDSDFSEILRGFRQPLERNAEGNKKKR